MTDPRLRELRRRLQLAADPEHARFHKGYHKSDLSFFGLKTPAMRSVGRAAFPHRREMERGEVTELAAELWSSPWFEERFIALELLAVRPERLQVRDLGLLKRIATECDGWVLLDHLACNTLSHLALQRGEPIYAKVRNWSSHRHMWTRRASILVHIRPARAGELDHAYAWETFNERLHEPEFFIRKAIGWALRECSKQYPDEVHDFLLRAGDKASSLTRREGARNLTPELRRSILPS